MFFYLFFVLYLAAPISCTTESAGITVRLTREGLQSAVDVAKQMLIEQLSELTLPYQCTRTEGYTFCVSEARFYDLHFPNVNATAIPNHGVKLSVRGAKIGVYGSIWSGIFHDSIGKLEVVPQG